MKTLLLKILILSQILNLNDLFSQENTDQLTLDEYLQIIAETHPIARNADLALDMAEANLLKAKGNFDPKLDFDLDQKYYEEKEYFDNSIASVKVPIWYGPEFKAGYELNEGEFLNRQNTVPGDGLMFLGVSLPLGRGLFYDSRRLEQQTAEIFQDAAEFERQKILADLFFRARERYYDWQGDYLIIEMLNKISELAKTRLDFVRNSYEFGDSPAIDTLESFANFRNRIIDANKQIAKYQEKIAKLSAMISFDPDFLNLVENIIPADTTFLPDTTSMRQTLDRIAELNPEILILNADLQSAQLSQRLARENLKPNLNVSYNFLNNGNDYINFNEYNEANYKWNVQFQFPLFLRKERGEVQKTEVKIKQTENKLSEKNAEVTFKLRGILRQITDLYPVIQEFQILSENYQRLLDAEFIKFQIGDSSLFKVNARESKLIEIEIKRIEMQVEINKLEAEFYKIAGVTGF